MCYEDHARPPLPPVRGGADSHGELTLTASDGTQFNAYFAHPDTRSNRAVVILPDFRGLKGFYKDLAVRFAQAGVHAVTIDYYTRTLGRAERPADTDTDFYRAELMKMDAVAVDLDTAAAVEWLRYLPGASIDSIFTVGFCCGGSYSWHQSGSKDRLSGHVSFYGVPNLVEEKRIADMRGPILMILAGKDFTPVEVVESLAEQIRANEGPVETQTYANAPHGFFTNSGEFAEECDDAWRRVLDFFERHAA